MEWVKDLLVEFFQWLVDGAKSILSTIPVPDWLDNAAGLWSIMPPAVLYFLDSLALPEGLAIVGAAWLIRFLIRRIPLIG